MKKETKELQDTIILYSADVRSILPLPYADEGIRCGFPSPAQDYIEQSIDLNKELIDNPESTFYGRVVGESMKDANINDGDILIIDKSKDPQDGDVVVAYLNGEFTVKTLDLSHKEEGYIQLVPANNDYPAIRIDKEQDFRIWGVVTYNIKKI